MWCFALDVAVFWRDFAFPKEGREGGPTGSVCYLQKNCRGEVKVMGALLSRAEPWRMRSLPQGGVWSNLWCYPLTSWYKVSMTLCSETARFITLWANDSNLSLNGTPTAWVLRVHPLFLVFDWQTVYCLVSQRHDLDFALGWRHCRCFWLFGSKNL